MNHLRFRIFRLRVLIVLTKPNDDDLTSSLSVAHNNYLSIFHRRLEWLDSKKAPDILRETMEAVDHFTEVGELVHCLIEGSK